MKLSSIILENNSVNIRLNKEELSKITSLVLDDYKNLSLEEAQSNVEIQEEILANASFYSAIKEGISSDKKLKEAAATGIWWLDAAIDVFGSVKNLLTSTSLGEWLVKKLKAFVDKFFPKLGKDPNSWPNKAVNIVKKIAKALSPKGIAWTIAAFKNKTLKPSKDQIEAQLEKATKVYKVLMVMLIALAAYKLIIFALPFAKAATTGPALAKTLTGAAQQAGISGFSFAGFNVVSLVKKVEHYKDPLHLKGHGEEVEDEIKNIAGELADILA